MSNVSYNVNYNGVLILDLMIAIASNKETLLFWSNDIIFFHKHNKSQIELIMGITSVEEGKEWFRPTELAGSSIFLASE